MHVTVDDVLNSPVLAYPIKFLDMCPLRRSGARSYSHPKRRPRSLLLSRPGLHASVVRHDFTHLGDLEWTRLHTLESASLEAYKYAGITNPLKEFDVAELYCPCSTCGVKWLDSLWLATGGRHPSSSAAERHTWTGILPVNPSGGVIATNPIGATR